MKKEISFFCLVAIASLFSYADGVPPEYMNKPAPIYKPNKGDCYVLLKPQPPYIESGNISVCKAVLANMNKFCSEPPQYNRRKLHPDTKDLQEPAWEVVDAAENIDLVRAIFLAQAYEENQADLWRDEKERITLLAKEKKLRLFKSYIDIDGREKKYVYKLENLNPKYDDFPGGNQAIYMVSGISGRGIAPGFEHWSLNQTGELISFNKEWFMVGYYDNYYKQFKAREIVNPTGGQAASISVCTFQNIHDRQGAK